MFYDKYFCFRSSKSQILPSSLPAFFFEVLPLPHKFNRFRFQLPFHFRFHIPGSYGQVGLLYGHFRTRSQFFVILCGHILWTAPYVIIIRCHNRVRSQILKHRNAIAKIVVMFYGTLTFLVFEKLYTYNNIRL